jgi:hypothetical protein
LALKVEIFLKNGILGGAFNENFEWVMYSERPPKTQGPQKKFGGPPLGMHVLFWWQRLSAQSNIGNQF